MIDGAIQDFALTVDKLIDHAARWHPDREIVTARGDGAVSRIGYAGLRARAKRITATLHAYGVRKGDRVATLAWNTQAHMECWYAVMGMGAICHTLNPRLTAEQLAWMIDQSEARIMFVAADLWPLANRIVAHARSECLLLVIDRTDGVAALPAQVDDLEVLIADEREELPWGEFAETTPCGLCFTSGTTGNPKGVTYTHRGNFLHTLRQLQADVTGLTGRDVVLPVVPMFHANAWGLPFSSPAVGAKLVFPGRFTDGASLARLIATENVTIAVGVPTVWLGLMDYLDAEHVELPSLKRIMVGGSPMSASLMRRIEARGISVQTSWGMTELSPLGTAMPPDEARAPELAGRPAIGLDLLLTDGAGQPLPDQRGKEGHLWVRGSSVVERYFGQTQSALRNGWFETGDLAIVNEAGQLAITGRSKDLIKSGGEWINPAEIEALVSALPEVALAVVIGRAHPKWGERPILLIELCEGQDLADETINAALRSHVPSWWLPDEIIRIDAIPLAATGKIDKLRLRREYAEFAEKQRA